MTIVPARPHRGERVLSQSVADTVVLLDPDSGEYFSLNDVGARVWQLSDGALTADQIAAALADEYDAPLDVVKADVLELLADLAAARLLDDHG